MNEDEIKQLGFVFDESYKHDEFNTNIYVNGVLEIDFTYKGDELLSCDLTIQEVNRMPITLAEITVLTKVFNTKNLK